jgi:hypothetical protein
LDIGGKEDISWRSGFDLASESAGGSEDERYSVFGFGLVRTTDLFESICQARRRRNYNII